MLRVGGGARDEPVDQGKWVLEVDEGGEEAAARTEGAPAGALEVASADSPPPELPHHYLCPLRGLSLAVAGSLELVEPVLLSRSSSRSAGPLDAAPAFCGPGLIGVAVFSCM